LDGQLTLVIGQYAIDWHLGDKKKNNLTETVKAWKEYWPDHLPLPHPSPRNNIWLKKNGWFQGEVLPELKKQYSSTYTLSINCSCCWRKVNVSLTALPPT